ncbi:hypothetical protein HMPREF3232_00277 [Fannyhessea vaginae]|nr:hypothetical protein HMPREF3232_00277 [Fannyhessea vaginae]
MSFLKQLVISITEHMFACTTKIHNRRIKKSIHLNHTMLA